MDDCLLTSPDEEDMGVDGDGDGDGARSYELEVTQVQSDTNLHRNNSFSMLWLAIVKGSSNEASTDEAKD